MRALTSQVKTGNKTRDVRDEAARRFPDMALENRNGHEFESLTKAMRHVFVASELLQAGNTTEVATELKAALDVLKTRAFFVFSLDKLGASVVSSSTITPQGSFFGEFSKELDELKKTKATAERGYHGASSSKPSSGCFSCGGNHLAKDCPSSRGFTASSSSSSSSSRFREPNRDGRRDPGRYDPYRRPDPRGDGRGRGF